MAVTMSLIYSVSRFAVCVLLSTMHLLLIVLYAISLSDHTGGVSEGFGLVISTSVILLLLTRAVCWVICRETQLEGKRILVFTVSVLAFCFLGCLVVTIRATHQPGLSDDFSVFSDAYSAAVSALALSWLAFFLASLLLIIDYLDRLPSTAKVTPYTSPPSRARPYLLVFRNAKGEPVKSIRVTMDTPHVPMPVYTGGGYPTGSKWSGEV